MNSFPPEIDPAMISPTADPANFPPHPGTISYYYGSKLLETVPAAGEPDEVKFYYERDDRGLIVSRAPIVKSVGWFYKKGGGEADIDEPAEASTIIDYDAEGNVVRTLHGGNFYH